MPLSVSEDEGMICCCTKNGSLNLEKLEAMTTICSRLVWNMIAIPEDTPAETIAAMIADDYIRVINMKITADIIPKVMKGI